MPLTDNDAGTHRARSVKVFRKVEVEWAAGWLPRGTDAPIREYCDTPNALPQLGAFQIGAAFAEDDCNLALVVEPVTPVGVDELAIWPDDLARQFPETPKSGSADLREIAGSSQADGCERGRYARTAQGVARRARRSPKSIYLRAVKALGLTFPSNLLDLGDEVID